MGSRKPGSMSYPAESRREAEPEGEADEAYWARKEDPVEGAAGEEGAQGNYDANFFQDDGLGIPGGGMDDDDDFADAREAFSPPVGGAEGDLPPTLDGVLAGSQEGAFGTQLVAQNRRLRPEYVQYARVAKKVDVRRLKEELWRGIGFEEAQLDLDATPMKTPAKPLQPASDGSLQFTDIVNNLQSVYPKQAMEDISTSYCFICLLHLANEKGLVINNQENFQDLSIRKDPTAEISVGGE